MHSKGVNAASCLTPQAGRLLITLIIFMFMTAPVGAQGDLYSALGEALEDQRRKDPSIQKALYSLSFDHWRKHYIAGQDDLADQDWKAVLKFTGSETDLGELVRRALRMMEFDEGKTTAERRQQSFLVGTWVRASEKALGRPNFRLVTVYAYASSLCDRAKKFSQAANYRRRKLDLESTHWGANSNQVNDTLCKLIEDLIKLNQKEEAQKFLNQLMRSSVNDQELQGWARKYQRKIDERK
ncbi:hypothetical protein BH10CYA1_BH10CYA1_43940 [soil metagenome]